MADDKEVEKTIAEDLVVTKYKLAGQIVNRKLICNLNLLLKQSGECRVLDYGDTSMLWFWTRVIAMRCRYSTLVTVH